jgi:hypothetical protein
LVLLCLNALFENLPSLAVKLLEPESVDVVLAYCVPFQIGPRLISDLCLVVDRHFSSAFSVL